MNTPEQSGNREGISRLLTASRPPSLKLVILTLLALIAFASNSLLCRIALTQTPIDPTTFVTIRLLSGALILWLALYLGNLQNPQKQIKRTEKMEGSWPGALALFIYALAFAFAYTQIPAGTGALLLFAAIQISMILYGLFIGERLSFWQITGLGFAITGLIILMLPKVGAPPLLYGFIMIISGLAWSVYSLLGRGTHNPTSATAGNFIRATPIALILFLLMLMLSTSSIILDPIGIGYAMASGAITSGLGYILWYTAVKELKVTQAATVQLSVPLITAFGGTLFLGEQITGTLIISSIAIILGVSLVIMSQAHK